MIVTPVVANPSGSATTPRMLPEVAPWALTNGADKAMPTHTIDIRTKALELMTILLPTMNE